MFDTLLPRCVSRVALCVVVCAGFGPAPAVAQAARLIWNPYHAQTAQARSASATDQETAAMRQVNLRRGQIGLAAVAANAAIATAARGHSAYLATNNLTGHYQSQTQAPSGFTGVSPGDRMTASGYAWRTSGEVIGFGPATGLLAVESLIQAIYHRFNIFSPSFNEAGAGYASGHPSYGSVVTVDFGNRQSPVAGDPAGWVGVYPYSGQTGVVVDFYSDEESPDPVAGANRVGYPVSIHVGNNLALTVGSFGLSDDTGASVAVQQLSADRDAHAPSNAAAIVPTQVLGAGRTYTARFSGSAGGQSVQQTWSFTTAPAAALGFSPSDPCIPVGSGKVVAITGGNATNVGWSNSSVISVSFQSSSQLLIRALAAGSATVTLTDGNNGQSQTTVTVAATCASSGSSSDRLFDWAEAQYRVLFEPPGAVSQSAGGFYFRYYPVSNTYLGTKDGMVYFYDAYAGQLLTVGALDSFMGLVGADGF